MTTTVTIRPCTDPTELFRHYDGQSEPQPAYIALDLETGGMWASYDAIVGSGTPEEVFHGRERWYGIPTLTAEAANELMERLKPLAARILADSDTEYSNGNRVGVLGEDAQAAEAEIEQIIASEYDAGALEGTNALVAAWDINGVVNGEEADTYNITAATTDERLEEIETELLTDMGGVAVCHGLDDHLRKLRDDLRAEYSEVYWSVMNGPSPDSEAVQPEPAGITVPAAVLEWAAGHGLDVDNPDVYLLVAPQKGAESMDGEVAFMEGRLSDQEAVALAAALTAQADERAERSATAAL